MCADCDGTCSALEGEECAASPRRLQRVVIVGAGQGGDACAAALRRLGHRGPITMVGAEPYPPYKRPPLSKAGLGTDTPIEKFYLRGLDHYAQEAIELLAGTQVIAIDRIGCRVELSSGTALPYDKLVIATGSRAREFPPSMVADNVPVRTLRTYDDAVELAGKLNAANSILVVGAGYLGLEIAAVAATRGLQVTVAEATSRILNRVAGSETADVMRELHEKNGVKFMLEATIKQIERNGSDGVKAIFDDGQIISANLCVAAIGGIPNDELARGAGLSVDGGVLVDEYARTSDPNIFAVGDCARLPFDGVSIRLESVQNAIEQGEVAAKAIMGDLVSYRPLARFWSDQFDAKLLIAGLNLGHTETVIVPGKRPGGQSIWYFREGALVAVDSINDPASNMIARRLLERGEAPVTPEAVRASAGNLGALVA